MTGHGVAWMIGGTAGEGLESGGEIFAAALAASGQRPSTQRDFPSRIRGGDTTFTVRLTPGGHLAPPRHIDLAMAFNASVLPRMASRLDGGLLFVDEGVDVDGLDVPHALFPFTRLAEEAGTKRAKNMVALGASAAIMAASLDALSAAIADRFKAKGEEVVAVNQAALQAGFNAAKPWADRYPIPSPVDGAAMLLSGNQSLALGALAAGCTFTAAYPITPASDILEYMTPRLHQNGGTALQMEDEMAALGACIGAGFAGARAITATSGPGASLMTETVGLAESTETPVVIVDCQRPGPSTGMPTKHGQEDLLHLVHGGHGEGVRIVLAPTDVADAHRTAKQAFDLADQFHCPVFIAMDQQMSLMKQTVAPLPGDVHVAPVRPSGPRADAWDGSVNPYGDPGDAPAPRGRPGEAWGIHLSNSTEHGPSGLTTEDRGVRTQMVLRRLARLDAIAGTTKDALLVHDQPDAQVTVVACGSTVGACLEAQELSETPLRVVALRLLSPLPLEALRDALGEGPVLVVEANATGQLQQLLCAALPIHDRIIPVRVYDGTPVGSHHILEALP